MIFFDKRYGTSNTNLAACLAALRVPMKNETPSIWTEEGEGEPKRVLTYYFETVGAGEPQHSAEVIASAWNNREEFERKYPEHTLANMRRGLDKLSWLTQVYHGKIKPGFVASPHNYQTKNIELAACIMGAGYSLHSFVKPQFRFNISKVSKQHIETDFDNYRNGTTPTCDMRRVFECRRILVDLAKRTPTMLRYSTGTSDEGMREGTIPKGVSADKLNKFFDLLYE